MKSLPAVIQSMRPPFLVLAPICVLLGASAIAPGTEMRVDFLLWCVVGALLAHISVNQINEYLDFRSGLDAMTRKTPFSGGSGALPGQPEAAWPVLLSGMLSLLATVALGIYFAMKQGWMILPIGAAGVVIIVLYTRWLNRLPWLCLVAPGLGFGVLMVIGTHYALQGSFSPVVWWAAAVPFFLVNNLLLLNQYPDIDADAQVGRRHLLIVYGVRAGNAVYAVFALAAMAALITGVVQSALPMLALIALIPMPLAVIAWRGAVMHGKALGEHPPLMAANVVLTLTVPALMALALFVG